MLLNCTCIQVRILIIFFNLNFHSYCNSVLGPNKRQRLRSAYHGLTTTCLERVEFYPHFLHYVLAEGIKQPKREAESLGPDGRHPSLGLGAAHVWCGVLVGIRRNRYVIAFDKHENWKCIEYLVPWIQSVCRSPFRLTICCQARDVALHVTHRIEHTCDVAFLLLEHNCGCSVIQCIYGSWTLKFNRCQQLCDVFGIFTKDCVLPTDGPSVLWRNPARTWHVEPMESIVDLEACVPIDSHCYVVALFLHRIPSCSVGKKKILYQEFGTESQTIDEVSKSGNSNCNYNCTVTKTV
jgi:hypothetical protein